MPPSSEPRVVVITGASSGIGRATALAFAGRGDRLVLAARRAAMLEEVAAECIARGGEALVVPTDVTEEGQVEELGRRALARFGRIDVWFNNPGVAAGGRFEEIPVAEPRRTVEGNLGGGIHGSHAAVRRFRARGQGRPVNMALVEGRGPPA